MELIRSLTDSAKLLFSSATGEGEEEEEEGVVEHQEEEKAALDALACLSCENPCEVHPWVGEGMLRKLDMEKPLAETVKKAERVLFLCSGQRGAEWSAKPGKNMLFNSSSLDRLAQTFGKILKNSPTAAADTVMYICSAPSVGNHLREDEIDIIAFPERVRYISVSEATFELILGGPSEEIPQEKLFNSYSHFAFVCTHGKRDKRCAVGGMLVYGALEEEIERRGLPVFLSEMSHVGGHKYAGNVLIYPGGHLYGRVRPCHAEVLIQNHVVEKKITREIYRGSQRQVEMEW